MTHATQVTVDLDLVLRLLGRTGASGIVTLEGPAGEVQLVLVGGTVLHATSPGTPKLGEALVARGVLSRDVLENALSHQRRKKVKQPLVTILLELGVVSREIAESEIEHRIADVLLEALSWERAGLRFEPAYVSSERVLLPESCQVESLLDRLARARPAAPV
jgi:hypothetical protein